MVARQIAQLGFSPVLLVGVVAGMGLGLPPHRPYWLCSAAGGAVRRHRGLGGDGFGLPSRCCVSIDFRPLWDWPCR